MKILYQTCVLFGPYRWRSNGELAYKACFFCEQRELPWDPFPWHAKRTVGAR